MDFALVFFNLALLINEKNIKTLVLFSLDNIGN